MSAYQSYDSEPDNIATLNNIMGDKIQFMSIYIPNLPEDLMLNGRHVTNESELKYFFEMQFPLGIVKRVDIATRPHRTGSHVRCAFIHFEKWHTFADTIRITLVNKGEIRLYGPYPNCNFYSSTNRSFERFITLKINMAPIVEVPALEVENMNVHQLVDNYRRIEKQLAEQTKLADDRLRRICELEAAINHFYVQ